MAYADDVLSVYDTVLQREPTALELSNVLSGPQDETSLSQLISTLSTSDEAEAFVWPVIRLYQGVYGRVPDADGLSFWVGRYRDADVQALDDAATPTVDEALVELARVFVDPVQTPEFAQRFGADPSGGNYVTALYENVLNRTADGAGFDYWAGRYESLLSELEGDGLPATAAEHQARAVLLEQFVNSDEYAVSAGDEIAFYLTGAAEGTETFDGSLWDRPLNLAPDAQDDAAAIDSHTVLSVDVLGNDSDPDGDALSLASVSLAEGSGSVSIIDGKVHYDPAGAYDGLAAGTTANVGIAYTVSDGHGGEDQGTLTVTIAGDADVIAPAAPAIAGILIDSGRSNGDQVTRDAAFLLYGTAEANAVVLVWEGNTVLGMVQADADGDWKLPVEGLDHGVHELHASATDAAGNASDPSSSFPVTVDLMAPAAPVIVSVTDTGLPGDGITNDATPTLTGTAEAFADIDIGLYSEGDGPVVIGSARADAEGQWAFTAQGLPDGAYSFLAYATDVAGNTSSYGEPFAIKLDTDAPVIVAPGSGTSASISVAENSIAVTMVKARDVDGDAITWSLVGGADQAFFTIDGLTGELSFVSAPNYETPADADSDNVYQMIVEASDGNLTDSLAIEVTVMDVLDLIDLTTLNAAQGFIIQGDAAADFAGTSVASAGDVNGDGFNDLIVGAPDGDDGGNNAGEAYVVFGKAGGFGTPVGSRQVLDLTNLAPADGFIIQGDTAGDNAGFSVASAGDVNGDGFGDLIVGARRGDDGGYDAGEAYVVFGTAGGFGAQVNGRQVLDLSSLATNDGFIIQGDTRDDRAGWSVASAGDVNGDGFDDLIVGAPHGSDGGADAGGAYVVFGKAGGFGSTDVTGRQVLDLTTMDAADGFIIQGDAAADVAGMSVASAGDVNGDGFDDLIVGAPWGDDDGDYAGEAYVVFGTAGGLGTQVNGRQVLDLSSLATNDGFVIQGDVGGDRAGTSVASAGDVNGDGFDDLIVGAPTGRDGGIFAGEAYVVFGKAGGFGTTIGGRQVIDLTSLGPVDGFIVQGDTGFDQAGTSVTSAGDVNGDGFDDLIVGASGGDGGGSNAGEAYVVFGKAGGFGSTDITGRRVLDLTDLAVADGFIIQGDTATDSAGTSVAAAGDVNGDGFDDLIVGAPYGDDGGNYAGEAYVVLGGAFGGSTVPITTTGTAIAEILIGGAGNDMLTGNGGVDVFRGGAGNDLFTIPDAIGFARIDGGTGTDTLAVSGAGTTLDMTTVPPQGIHSVERVDLTGTGNNTLLLDVDDLLDASGGSDPAFSTVAGAVHNTLVVIGNAGDAVTLGEGNLPSGLWSHVGDDVALNSLTDRYDVYNFIDDGTVVATIGIGADLTVDLF